MTPNIVFIITDNQSPWTMGCYGNNEILTPNTDQLAQEGIRFTNAFCSNPVCSPNRATCLTGRMPSQHGIHNWLGQEKPDAQMGPEAYCTIAEFASLPRILAGEDYTCGMTGKWHLGNSMNPQLGFTYWFCKPTGHTTTFYDTEAIWEGEVYNESRYYLDAITDHAIDFLNQAQTQTEPFFLYVGYNGPYGLDHDMRKGHRNRHTDYYADKPLHCFPREDAHPWLNKNLDCIRNETAMRSYACAVSGVDDAVGRILETLEELNLTEDTLVIYTADHGLCAGHHGVWGMADHGRPLTMYDENLRVPLILRHPGRILADQSCDTTTCNYDLLPSLLDHLDLDNCPQPPGALPGRSFAPAFSGQALDWEHEVTFHEYENTRTIRTPEWKLTRRCPDGPDDLYDLVNDPEERFNVIDESSYAGILISLDAQLREFFRQYADPEYDLWQNGHSKAGRVIPAPG